VYPGTVPGAWSSSYTPGLGRRGPWVQEFEANLSKNLVPIS
jgi:hypothetical protein